MLNKSYFYKTWLFFLESCRWRFIVISLKSIFFSNICKSLSCHFLIQLYNFPLMLFFYGNFLNIHRLKHKPYEYLYCFDPHNQKLGYFHLFTSRYSQYMSRMRYSLLVNLNLILKNSWQRMFFDILFDINDNTSRQTLRQFYIFLNYFWIYSSALLTKYLLFIIWIIFL